MKNGKFAVMPLLPILCVCENLERTLSVNPSLALG